MKRVLMACSLLGVLGCSTLSRAPLPPVGPSFTCEGSPYTPEPHYRADVPMGRLEVEKLSAVSPPPPPDPAGKGEGESMPMPNAWRKPRFPVVRLRVVAEAAPLGTLAAVLSREIGLGILVKPALVDLRVSLSLPDATAEEVFELLHGYYDVAAETAGERVIVLLDRIEVLRRRYEPPEVLVRVIPVTGLPAEHLAAAYCKQLASESGSVSVIGDMLLMRDVRDRLARFDALLQALRNRDPPPASSGEASPP